MILAKQNKVATSAFRQPSVTEYRKRMYFLFWIRVSME